MTYTVQLSPWTATHLKERVRYYHYLQTGDYGGRRLENGGKTVGCTWFGPLKVLCPEQSAEEIAGKAPCPVCALRRYIYAERWNTDTEYAYFNLEPRATVTLEFGLLAVDGKKSHQRVTQFLEVPANALRRFPMEQWIVQEIELFRDPQTHQPELRPTVVPLGKTRHSFGKTLIIRPHTDSFVRKLVTTMEQSNFVRPEEGRADRMRELFPGAVFVPDWFGTKRPMRRGWQEYSPRWMRQWADYSAILDQSNIQLRCGPPSKGICSFDMDDMSQYNRFIRVNSWAAKARKLWGARGCAIFFRLKGEYPARVFPIMLEDTNEPVGELRCGNCLQTVSGLHPSGVEYRLENGEIPEIAFEQFVPLCGWKPLEPEKPKVRLSGGKHRCRLDLESLQYVKDSGQVIDCQCPSCIEKGHDRSGEHLRIWKSTWAFHCIVGCSYEDILAVAGKDNDDDETEDSGDED